MTRHCEHKGLKYYPNPQINTNPPKHVDGLILNEDMYLQNRLMNLKNGSYLCKELELNPDNLKHVKAIQFLYTNDTTDKNIIKLSIGYQAADIMLFIISTRQLTYYYHDLIELPSDKRIRCPNNIKVVTHKLFAEFIGFEENFEEVYDSIINSCLNEDILSLKSYKDSIQ